MGPANFVGSWCDSGLFKSWCAPHTIYTELFVLLMRALKVLSALLNALPTATGMGFPGVHRRFCTFSREF